eukprot:368076-Prorocentrum_minimum.AAC.1
MPNRHHHAPCTPACGLPAVTRARHGHAVMTMPSNVREESSTLYWSNAKWHLECLTGDAHLRHFFGVRKYFGRI